MELFKRNFYSETSSEDFFDKLLYFRDYVFYTDSHMYTYKGEQVETSVTKFISQFETPFDRDKWLPKKAKERGITVEELAAEWKHKADVSTNTGTFFHKHMEEGFAGKYYWPDFTQLLEDLRDEVYNRYLGLYEMGTKFQQDFQQQLIPVKSEFTVGLSTKIAGQIDQLFYNRNTRKLDIYDWKTNKSIECWSPYRKKLLGPFSHLDDCELNKYSLQLSTYKYLLEKQGISIGELNLVWFNENNKSYQIFPCRDVSSIIGTLLEE